MVTRLSELDLPARLGGTVPSWLTELLVAVLLTGAATILRFSLNLLVTGVVPYALLFPAVLVATLLAGRRSGVIVIAVGGLITQYYVVPPIGSFAFERAADALSLVLFLISSALVVAVADLYRRSALLVAEERAAKLQERDLALAELNHRVKNSFAIVHGLLNLHGQSASEPKVRDELKAAADRLYNFSEAYADLYAAGDDVSTVDMKEYLERLCASLGRGLLLDGLTELRVEAQSVAFNRDRAVAVGLMVNELVTNAAKYAFVESGTGLIEVLFTKDGSGWTLIVRDNGRGLPPDYPGPKAGIGLKLVQAFARQAQGELTVRSEKGAIFQLTLRT